MVAFVMKLSASIIWQLLPFPNYMPDFYNLCSHTQNVKMNPVYFSCPRFSSICNCLCCYNYCLSLFNLYIYLFIFICNHRFTSATFTYIIRWMVWQGVPGQAKHQWFNSDCCHEVHSPIHHILSLLLVL